MEAGRSDVAVYLCGREAYMLSEGWDQRILDYMEDNPEVGLAGTLGYSPAYFTGADYIGKLEPFSQNFGINNLRTRIPIAVSSMFKEEWWYYDVRCLNRSAVLARLCHITIPTWNTAITSKAAGGSSGNIPGLVSLYHKTRPELSSRMNESLIAVHPASPATAPVLDAVVKLKTNFCNVCGTAAPFSAGLVCANCNSTGFDRSLYRFLAESNLTFRKLKGLLVSETSSSRSALEGNVPGNTQGYADFVPRRANRETMLQIAST